MPIKLFKLITVNETADSHNISLLFFSELCAVEHIQDYPTFKLFVGGKFLTRYNQSPNFINMRNFVENAPLGTHVDEGRFKNEQKIDVKFIPGGQKPKQEL